MRGLDWLVAVFAVAVAVLHHAAMPGTWRRPVRAEFLRFMDLVCLKNLGPTMIAAALVGTALVGQALYWLDQFGQTDAITDVIVFVMVREIGPLIVGLIALGTGGILLVGEVSTLRVAGQLAALDSQGVDPFQMHVVPRVVAIVFAVFAHCVIFTMVAFLFGYVVAFAAGVTAATPQQFLAIILNGFGSTGYLILPAKVLAIGLTIGAICSLTALDNGAEGKPHERLTASGFLRGISGILLVSATLSIVL